MRTMRLMISAGFMSLCNASTSVTRSVTLGKTDLYCFFVASVTNDRLECMMILRFTVPSVRVFVMHTYFTYLTYLSIYPFGNGFGDQVDRRKKSATAHRAIGHPNNRATARPSGGRRWPIGGQRSAVTIWLVDGQWSIGRRSAVGAAVGQSAVGGKRPRRASGDGIVFGDLVGIPRLPEVLKRLSL